MSRNLTADVAIIGAGVIGSLTAYYLTLKGVKPVIIESDGIASGASGSSSGFLTPYSASSDPRVIALSPDTLKLHGELAKALPAEAGFDYGYETVPYLRCAFTEDGVKTLKEWQAQRAREGTAVEWLTPAQARSMTPWLTGEILGALNCQVEPTLDSYRFTLAAARVAEKRGARVVTGKAVGLLTETGRGQQKKATGVRLADGSHITATAVVLAMGPWAVETGDWLGYPVPIKPMRGQILYLAQPGPGEGPDIELALAAVDLGGSILRKKDRNTIISATVEDAGFDRTPTREARELLISQAMRLSSRVLSARLTGQTACLRPMSADRRAYVGKAPGWDGVYLAAGHFSEGVHFGPLTGAAVANMIADGSPGYDISVFDPQRLTAGR